MVLPIDVPDLGGLDLQGGLLVIVALVAFVFIVIPLLLFGIELIIAGSVIAAGISARLLLGRPWVIEARTVDIPGPQRVLEWKVRGWTKSRRLISQVSDDLAAGREPGTR